MQNKHAKVIILLPTTTCWTCQVTAFYIEYAEPTQLFQTVCVA